MDTHMPDPGPAQTDNQSAPQTGEPGSAQQQTFDWDSPENPWKRNFDNYRVEADRRATQLSQYESLLEDLRSTDLDKQRAAATALGIDLVEDEPAHYDDPTDALAAELAETQRKLQELAEKDAQRDAERQRQEEAAQLASRIDDALDDLKLDNADTDWVLARAVALGAGPDGLPKIKEAYEQLQTRDEAVMRKWGATKRPNTITPGSTGKDAKPVHEMTDAERVAWATARFNELSAE